MHRFNVAQGSDIIASADPLSGIYLGYGHLNRSKFLGRMGL